MAGETEGSEAAPQKMEMEDSGKKRRRRRKGDECMGFGLDAAGIPPGP